VELLPDFDERCARFCTRLQAGEPMTVEYLAHQLGLSYDLFAVALATYATTFGVAAMVDLSQPRPLH